jgi:hypothetical protein
MLVRVQTIVAANAGSVAVTVLAGNPGITPSFAGTARTWTVTPGGAAVAKSGVIKLTDTKTGKAGTCTSSTVSGKIKAGSGLPGHDIGSVTSAVFRTCSGPASVPFTVTASDLSWQVNVTSYDPKDGVVRGTVSHLRVVVTGRFCSAVVNGTNTTRADGVVSAAYTDRAGSLTFLAAGGNLHFRHVKGCAPLLNSGDPATFTAVYAITPRQAVTSP